MARTRICIFAVATAVTIAVAWAVPKTARADDNSAEELVQLWAAAYKQNSPEALLKFYEISDKLDVRMSSGIRLQGFNALEKMVRADMADVEFTKSTANKIDCR